MWRSQLFAAMQVVETFEQLSTLAEMMASKIKIVSSQLERSKVRWAMGTLAPVMRIALGLTGFDCILRFYN